MRVVRGSGRPTLAGVGKVTFVVGFAGSGKSWLIDNEIKPDRAFHESFAAPGEHDRHHSELVACLRRGKRCAVSELQTVGPEWRAWYEQKLRAVLPDVEIQWIYFEHDIETANHNCRRVRPDKLGDPTGEGHVAINRSIERRYVIPVGADVRKIYRLP